MNPHRHESASSRREGVIFGSRFNGGAIASLRAHQRRASAQDIDGRIRVGMAGETAVTTGEAGLALATCLVDGSARRAFLRRVGGVHGYQAPAALFNFVGEEALKASPRLLKDAPIEAALATSGFRHIRNLKPFDRNHAEPTRDGETGFVRPVLAAARNAASDPSDPSLLPFSALGSAHTARKYALPPSLTPLKGFVRRDRKELARGQCSGIGDPSVNADRVREGRGRSGLNFAGEGGEPLPLACRECDARDATADGTRRSKFYPTDLRHLNAGPLRVELARVDLWPLVPEAFIHAPLTRGGEVGASSEEACKGAVEVSKRVVQRGSASRRDPVDLRSKAFDLAPLVDVVERLPGRRAELPPKVTPLFPREIIDEPDNSRRFSKRRRLFGSWIKPVAKRAENHGSTLRQIDAGAKSMKEKRDA